MTIVRSREQVGGTKPDDHVLDVLAAPYNAAGDGHTSDQKAIQQALDDAAGEGVQVLLRAGHTFVAGHLRIYSNTTLIVDGVLRQSTDASSYGYEPAIGHDLPGGQFVNYHLGSRENLPLIHSRLSSRVRIMGSGTLQMMGGPDDDVINIAPVGLYRVSDYEVSGLTVLDSHSWMVMLYTTDHGLVRDLTLRSEHRNSDGVCILNSQDIRVTGNTMNVADDAVYVRTEYDERIHRPDIHWYSMRWPQPSTRIEIDHNTIRSRTRGFAFIPWGAACPDQNQIEISDVYVHDNSFTAPLPVSSWTDDPTNGGEFASRGEWHENASNYDNHVPIKNVRIVGNEYVRAGELTASARHTELRHLSRITNFVNDLGLLSWPGTDRDPADLDDLLPNGDFGLRGLAYWSHVGDVEVLGMEHVDGLDDERLWQVAKEVMTRPLSWGRVALLRSSTFEATGPDAFTGTGDQMTAIYQGLGLKYLARTGPSTNYEFSVNVAAGPGGAAVYAYDPRAHQFLVEEEVGGGAIGRVTVRIPVAETRDSIHLGVRLPAGTSGGWALASNARVTCVSGVV